MLKTMLFRGTGISGSESWALEFDEVQAYSMLSGNIHNLRIGKNGMLYIECPSYRPLTGKNRVRTAVFAKINDKGEILWQNYFKHNSNNYGTGDSCITTIGNNIVVGVQGSTSLTSGSKPQLGLYSVDGDELAKTEITNPKVSGITASVPISGISSNNNNIYVYGSYIAKLTKNLSSADWIKPLVNHNAIGIICDPNNDYTYFYGNIPINNNRNAFCVGSLSSTGELRWSERIGGNSDQGTGICVTSDAVYVGGEVNDTDQNTYGIIAKYTKSGSLLWIKKITYVIPCTICSDNTGNIYIGDYGGRLTKLSSDGNILSCIQITHSNYGSMGFTNGATIQIDTKGNFYFIVSYSNTDYLIKLTKNDIKQIATTSLTIGPLIFRNYSSSLDVSTSISTTSYPDGIINNSSSATYNLTPSTFTFIESNLTPKLYYKG